MVGAKRQQSSIPPSYITNNLSLVASLLATSPLIASLLAPLPLVASLLAPQVYVDNSKYESHLSCINRLEGPQTDLPLYASYLPLNTAAEVSFYLDFLSNISTQNSEVIALLCQGITSKSLPAKCSLDGVASQFLSHVENGGNAFLGKLIDSDSAHVTEEVKNSAKRIVTEQVVPSFQEVADFLTSTYAPSLPTEIASTKRHPWGKEYYQKCLEFHTTTTLTCEEIHDIGLKEVKRITEEMKRIAEAEGHKDLDSYKVGIGKGDVEAMIEGWSEATVMDMSNINFARFAPHRST